MAFKVTLTPTYKTEVIVVTPNENGGNDTSKFKVIFKRFTVDELEGEGGLRSMTQKEVLLKAVAGWEGLVADDGTEFDYSTNNLETLLSIPHALKAIAETFWLTQYSAKQKN